LAFWSFSDFDSNSHHFFRSFSRACFTNEIGIRHYVDVEIVESEGSETFGTTDSDFDSSTGYLDTVNTGVVILDFVTVELFGTTMSALLSTMCTSRATGVMALGKKNSSTTLSLKRTKRKNKKTPSKLIKDIILLCTLASFKILH